jgi:hypothetical protein
MLELYIKKKFPCAFTILRSEFILYFPCRIKNTFLTTLHNTQCNRIGWKNKRERNKTKLQCEDRIHKNKIKKSYTEVIHKKRKNKSKVEIKPPTNLINAIYKNGIKI